MMVSEKIPLEERTVGVVHRDAAKMCPGYTLFSAGPETYLIDEDGRCVHQWRSKRNVFASYLLPNGHLLRDGSEAIEAPGFAAGGAAGFLEEVTWDNELVWEHSLTPYSSVLSHHDLHPMPNGNVLVHCWERKSREEAMAAGRRPDLIPDGEVWDEQILEVKPNGKGGADLVWKWCVWDHLVQDYDPKKYNYGNVAENPQLLDINYCVPGGKDGARNRDTVKGSGKGDAKGDGKGPPPGKTGEKDWLHVNCFAYDEKHDEIILVANCNSELMFIDHSTTTEEAASHKGGKHGRGGDILFRFGNAQVARRGSRMNQVLFCPHNASWIEGPEGARHILLFNNGRAPDRHWSSVEEYRLPFTPGTGYEESYTAKGTPTKVWFHGPPNGRQGSFYCTHISGAQRLPNGNTLVNMGPQAILFEVTPDQEEVWRYINPVMQVEGAAAYVRQGDFRTTGRFSLFIAKRYHPEDPCFKDEKGEPRKLIPFRYLEV